MIKNKKRSVLTLVVLLVLGVGNVNAQKDGEYKAYGKVYYADDTAVVRGKDGVGWVRSNLWDSWFVQAQGGGLLYYGLDDSKGPFKDHITAAGEINVGRRIFPMWGFRAGVGYAFAHGFLEKEHYSTNIMNHGYTGQCGTDASGNLLGGYYWDYDDNLLQQKWKYIYFGADIFLDLNMFRGSSKYDPTRKWTHIVYGGVNTKFAQSETDTTNHRSEAHIGYVCKYNISPSWNIYIDVRASLVERLFDREWVSEVERFNAIGDPTLNCHIGVNYRFNMRSKAKRDAFDKTVAQNLNTEGKTVKYLYTEKTVKAITIDTLLSYKQVVAPTPEMQRKIDSLQHVIDSVLDDNKNKANNMPLDSILMNNLLPYEMVFFQKDKWDILPSEEMKIERMARVMKAYPKETFILTGSADSKTGTVERNIFLSHNRADVVYNILVTQYDIEPERLKREYLGGILDYKPFELNRTTVIIMDHPAVRAAFEEIKKTGQAGGGEVEFK